jgi:hypothetical protein
MFYRICVASAVNEKGDSSSAADARYSLQSSELDYLQVETPKNNAPRPSAAAFGGDIAHR